MGINKINSLNISERSCNIASFTARVIVKIFAIVIDKLYGLSEEENNSKEKKESISHLIKYSLHRKNNEKKRKNFPLPRTTRCRNSSHGKF
jgi:hypothetical protein